MEMVVGEDAVGQTRSARRGRPDTNNSLFAITGVITASFFSLNRNLR